MVSGIPVVLVSESVVSGVVDIVGDGIAVVVLVLDGESVTAGLSVVSGVVVVDVVDGFNVDEPAFDGDGVVPVTGGSVFVFVELIVVSIPVV